MKRVLSVVIAAVAVFALSGCGGGTDGGGAGGSSLVIDNVQQGSNIARFNSSINLLNSASSQEDICDVYSAPASSNNWSRLRGTPIAPGHLHEWGSDHCDQDWDLRVVACSGEEKIKSYYRECFTTTYFTFKNW